MSAARPSRRILPVALILVALLAGACGRAGDTGHGPTSDPDALRVVTTTTILADLVRQVGGSRVAVTSLVPKGGEVHTFDPTPAAVQRVTEAQLIFANGLGLDDWLAALVRDTGTSAPVVRLGEDLPGVTYLTGSDGTVNPHLWLDVEYASKYIDRIEASLAAADPKDASAFAAAAGTYRARLAALDTEIAGRIGALPDASKVVVSFHDAFPYFAAAYGLTIVGSVVEAPGQDPSAGELASLITTIRGSGAKAIFAEAQFNPKLAQTIADETGVVVVSDLYTDSVGDPPADTYEGMMRSNADKVVAALSGG